MLAGRGVDPALHTAELVNRGFGAPADLFIDSGGFSAWSKGAMVSLDDYIEFVRLSPRKWSIVATLDVIGDAAATAANTHRMMKELPGEAVYPVFHVGSDWKWLRYWVERSPHLCVGGMVPYTSRPAVLRTWLRRCFDIIPPTTKVHGLGLTMFPLLREFPFASVDSSSWVVGMRYGVHRLFDEQRGTFVPVGGKAVAVPRRDLLARYGLTDLPARDDYAGYVRMSLDSWYRAERWIRSYWERRRGESPTGDSAVDQLAGGVVQPAQDLSDADGVAQAIDP